MDRFGAVDAGGTSFRCMVATGPDAIVAETSFPTTTPEETLTRACDFFNDGPGQGVRRLGVACFGPVAVDPGHPGYGHILETTKPGWSGAAVLQALAAGTGLPIVIESDVNAAALSEYRWGAGRGIESLAYVTVGTGIGAGIISNGRTLHGGLHPEAGHIRVPRFPGDDFPGVCPFHGDCVEGLASAPALKARWGADPANLPCDHPAWEIEAHYLGHLAATLILVSASQLVIFGGGVMARTGLADQVARKAEDLLAGYSRAITGPVSPVVTGAGLGLKAGVLGALALAMGH
jgi:fructokinase